MSSGMICEFLDGPWKLPRKPGVKLLGNGGVVPFSRLGNMNGNPESLTDYATSQ